MRKVALIAVAAIALAACADPANSQSTGPRPTRVMVNKQLLWIDQEPIIVRGGKEVAIVWQIATKGYEFPDDGIVFKEGKEQFVSCAAKGQVFQCLDRNTERGRFKYTIRVVRRGTKEGPEPLDPWVVNDP